ncbi:MAG: hypothetical protein SVU69_11670 [Pseudomonadota bacterium]|nr:hypothetical protein [Pseudomonadota bacterium]
MGRLLASVIFVFLLVYVFNVFGAKYFDLKYSGLAFVLPSDFRVIGDLGGQENILIFRYSEQKGKNYVAFTDMSNDKSLDYGCHVNEFFNILFSPIENSSCNEKTLRIMSETFVSGAQTNVWKSDNYIFNYSETEEKTFLFISGKDGKLVKIDSDFLDDGAYKQITKNLN